MHSKLYVNYFRFNPHAFFLAASAAAFFAFSAATLALVLEMNKSISIRPATKANAGNLKR